MRRRLIVAVTGASDSALARQLAGAEVEVYLVVSEGARVTTAYELGKVSPSWLPPPAMFIPSAISRLPLPAARTGQAG